MHRGAVSIEEYIYRVNMVHMVKSGQFNGQYAQIRVIMPKYGRIYAPTCPNFGQLVMYIGPNNDQILLPMDQTSDSDQCSNRHPLDLITLLVNFSM